MAAVKFSSLPSNRSNLVNWYKASEGILPVSGGYIAGNFCFDENFARKEFTRPYPKVRHTYSLPMVAGEKVSFFTNFPNPGEIPPGASIRIYTNNENGEDLTARFSVQKITLDGGNLHISVTPSEFIREYTEVRLAMLGGSGITHLSRSFVVMPGFDNVFRLTVENQNSVYFHYPYLDIVDPNMKQSLLVHGNLVEVTFPGETEVYREVTTSRERQEVGHIGRRLTIETYYMDMLAHEGMAAAFFHKGVKVNDLNVTAAGGYEPNMTSGMDLSKGTIELIDLSYGHRIKSC